MFYLMKLNNYGVTLFSTNYYSGLYKYSFNNLFDRFWQAMWSFNSSTDQNKNYNKISTYKQKLICTKSKFRAK